MNLFPAKTEHQLPDEIKKRLTGGLLISLLVHAFILSLQFGLPGVGLPGLEVPWDKRRAETPELSVQIADVVPAAATTASPAGVTSSDPVASANLKSETNTVSPSKESAVSAAPLASPPAPAMTDAPKSTAPQGIQLLAPSIAVASVAAPEKKTRTKAAKAKKSVTRTPVAMSRPPRVVVVDVPDIITQNNFRSDTFSVAVRDPEESKKELTQNEEQRMFPDPVSQSVEELTDLPPVAVSRFEPDAQQRERREQKILQATKELLQEKIAAPASTQQSVKQMEDASRKQIAEAVRKEADAALALKQQEAQQQHEAEQQQQRILQEASKANASALAATALQRIDNMKLVDDNLKQQMQAELVQREQQRKERQTAMLTARQQAEEREEELKRQREEALRKQQQMEMQIAQARNDELLERQKIEKLAEQRAQQQVQQQAQEAQQKAQQERLEKQRAENVRQQAQQTEQALAQQREREQAAVAAAKSTGTNKLVNTNDHPLTAGRADGGSTVGKASVAGVSSTSAGSAGTNATGSGDKTAAFVLPQSLLSSDLANRSREQARGLDLLRGTPPLPRADAAERPRRRSVLGSAEKDIQLRMYIDSWKQKIERNGNLNFSQTSRDKARGDPVVTVAIRSDGSVEEITIHRSSGRADLDQAVRNIVRINAKYAAFPPNIAAQYDVIEVRRVWNFDDGLRILEELR
jgi:TonB family protein